MKKSVVFSAVSLALMGTNAFAQSSVTMYGVIDTMVHYSNNQITNNGTLGNKVQLQEGTFQGPRFGIKGVEDLGSGTSAVFQLEAGFVSNNGTSDQQGQLFGRQAYVGLKNKNWGEIDAGRQYGVAFDILGAYDPLGTGNTPENSWQLLLTGVRFDNSIKYTNTWGPVSAEVQYSLGGVSGSNSQGRTAGLGLSYTEGPISVGAFEQHSTDANSNKANVAGIGASYIWDATTFYLNYINSRRDAGFASAASNSGGPLANTSMLRNANNTLRRSDNVVTAGLVYNATPAMSYTLGYMTDFVKNETSLGNSGRIGTAYAVADYRFSKRTDVYLSLDHTRVSGGEIDNGASTNTLLQFSGSGLGGAKSRTGVGIGLRTLF